MNARDHGPHALRSVGTESAGAHAGAPPRPLAQSRPLAVCHIISTYPPLVGGAQQATERLCRRLRRRGVDVEVLTRRYPGLRRSEEVDGVRIRRLGVGSSGKIGALSFALAAFWHLAVRAAHRRVVHVQSLDAPLLVGLAARTLLGRRLVMTVHGEAKISARARTAGGRLRLRLLRRLADGHTALTATVRRELIEQGVPASRIRLIPNGVDLAVYRPPRPGERRSARARLGVPAGATAALCLGRLVAGKRVDLVLRAWAMLPVAGTVRCLLIVGDGPERPALERLAGELTLAGVRFTGATDDVLPFLHAADAYVSASGSEGLSLALLEAMAARLAVVAARIPGNEAIVRHGENGLLVPPDDPAALSRALGRLLGSPALVHRLGANARRHVARAHALEHCAARHQRLYRRLTAEQPAGPMPRRVGAAPASATRQSPGAGGPPRPPGQPALFKSKEPMRMRGTENGTEDTDAAGATDDTDRTGADSQGGPPGPLKILRLVLRLGDESAPLHQFSLAAPRDQQITLCTFFPVREKLPPWIRLVPGDGTVRGFIRTLRRVVAAGDASVIHAHSPHVGVFCLMARSTARAAFPPTVFTVHNSYHNFRMRNRLLLLPIFAGFQRIICCGHASFDSFPPLYRRLAGRRMRVVQNAIDLERIDRLMAAADVAADRPFTVLGIARLIRLKNVSVVLNAFLRADVEGARLTLIGVGEQYEALRKRIAAHAASRRVELTGLISREAVYRRLRGADLFVSASRGEGLPIAVLEAMSCACPVVLSDIAPHREIARGADFIPLVAPDDVDGFVSELRRFHAMPPRERARLGAQCRRLVEDRFDLERMHREYRAEFDAVVAEHRGGPAAAPPATAAPSR